MFVCINSRLIDQKEAKISTADHGFLYGDGVYETLRTVHGDVWLFDEHMGRLRDSAKAVGLSVPYSDKAIFKIIKELMNKNGLKEARIRITLTRGDNNFDFNSCKKPFLLISAEKLKLPEAGLYKKGVKVITFKGERTMPHVKSVSMLVSAMGRRAAKEAGSYEAFLVNRRGYVTEGSISNYFIVKDGVLVTPKDDILQGTVRNYILNKLNPGQTKILRKIPLKELFSADEIFLTGTIKGIMPVIMVDGKKIGSGRPGKITKKLINDFKKSL